jgi:hypothetical protein
LIQNLLERIEILEKKLLDSNNWYLYLN